MVPLVAVTLRMQLGTFTKPHGFPKPAFFLFSFFPPSLIFPLESSCSRDCSPCEFFISQMTRSYTCPPIYSWCSRVGNPNSLCSCHRRAHALGGGPRWGGSRGKPLPQRCKSPHHTAAQFKPSERDRGDPVHLHCHPGTLLRCHLHAGLGLQPPPTPRKDAQATRAGRGCVGHCPSAVLEGCPAVRAGSPLRGPQVADAPRRSTGSAAAPRRAAGRGAGGTGGAGAGEPTAAFLSLQVELLPERDLDNDGTKISVSGAAGSPRRRAGSRGRDATPHPGAAGRRLSAGTAGCGEVVVVPSRPGSSPSPPAPQTEAAGSPRLLPRRPW